MKRRMKLKRPGWMALPAFLRRKPATTSYRAGKRADHFSPQDLIV